jgi:hypothetical protein
MSGKRAIAFAIGDVHSSGDPFIVTDSSRMDLLATQYIDPSSGGQQ